jgi:hemerythrin
MALHWEPRLAVGVASIDSQHKQLIEALNGLLAAMATSRGKEEVGKLLKFLGDYTVSHFADEERLMARTRYPGAEAHKREHDAFIIEFKELAGEFAKNGPTTSMTLKLNGKVCEWLRQHIAVTDTALAAHLNRPAAAA